MNNKVQEQLTLNNDVVLRNRIVMSPMTTWSANNDQTVSNAEVNYYGARAKSVGMVITGSSHVQENGVGFANELGAYDDRFIPGLTKLAGAIKTGGAKAILQLNHAGDKALPQFINNGDVVSSSAVPALETPFAPAQTPRDLQENEILQVIQAFGAATKRAIQAGFDGIEIHGAHGFLIQNFLSPHYNQRTDQWGGSLDNRLRFAMAVVDETKSTVAKYADEKFIIGYRITLEEPESDGLRFRDTEELLERLIDKNIGYLHLSLGDALTNHSRVNDDNEPYIEKIAKLVNQRVPLMAAGSLNSLDRMDAALNSGLDLVAVGQTLVANPDLFSDEPVSLTLSENELTSINLPKTMFDAVKQLGKQGVFNFKFTD